VIFERILVQVHTRWDSLHANKKNEGLQVIITSTRTQGGYNLGNKRNQGLHQHPFNGNYSKALQQRNSESHIENVLDA